MPEKTYTFSKEERLCSKKIIEKLYSRESDVAIISEYPFILKWINDETTILFPARIVISISNKYSRKAVDRNRIRRQLRELYRLNKQLIYDSLQSRNRKLALLLIFAGCQKYTYDELQTKFKNLVDRFIKNMDAGN